MEDLRTRVVDRLNSVKTDHSEVEKALIALTSSINEKKQQLERYQVQLDSMPSLEVLGHKLAQAEQQAREDSE